MSQNCIDLTSDDEGVISISIQRVKHKHIFLGGESSTKRSRPVNNRPNNSASFNALQSYTNNDPPFQLPTIVNVQSLARSGCNGNSNVQPVKVKQRRKSLTPTKKSVFNKQKLERPVSTPESIAESIDSCIRKFMYPDEIEVTAVPPVAVGAAERPIHTFSEVTGVPHVAVRAAERTIHTFTEVDLASPASLADSSKSDVEILEPMGTAPILPAEVTPSLLPKNESSVSEVSKNTLLFREFLGKCVSLEENESDKLRASEKLTSYHEKADQEYRESTKFAETLKNHMEKISSNNLYECVKDVLDELKLNRAAKRATLIAIASSSNKVEVADKVEQDGKLFEMKLIDPTKRKEVNRLVACLEELNKKIKKLEEAEVDLSDEEDSSYFKMQRYRLRFAQVHKKLCEYNGVSQYQGRVAKRKIHFKATKYSEVNRVVERWLNKKGTFPDFADVIGILQTLNLKMKPDHLHHLAEEVFRAIGEKLQKRRQLDFWDALGEFDTNSDPASTDPSLNAILDKNRKICKEKETEIINQFVTKQLEGQEASGSSGSDEEEEEVSPDLTDSDTSEADKNMEIANNEEGSNSIVETAVLPASSMNCSRTPLTEMINEAVSEGLSTVRKRKKSVEVRSISKRRITSDYFQERQLDNATEGETSDGKEENRRHAALMAKPFGSVGQVIELNHLKVHYKNPVAMQSLFKDCTNTIHGRSRSLGPVIREINKKYQKAREFKDLKLKIPNNLCRSESCLTTAKNDFKRHGAIGHDPSSNQNVPQNTSNGSTSKNQTAQIVPPNNDRITGSGNSGDDDKDNDRKKVSSTENDGCDDDDQEEEGDGELDTVEDASQSGIVDANQCALNVSLSDQTTNLNRMDYELDSPENVVSQSGLDQPSSSCKNDEANSTEFLLHQSNSGRNKDDKMDSGVSCHDENVGTAEGFDCPTSTSSLNELVIDFADGEQESSGGPNAISLGGIDQASNSDCAEDKDCEIGHTDDAQANSDYGGSLDDQVGSTNDATSPTAGDQLITINFDDNELVDQANDLDKVEIMADEMISAYNSTETAAGTSQIGIDEVSSVIIKEETEQNPSETLDAEMKTNSDAELSDQSSSNKAAEKRPKTRASSSKDYRKPAWIDNGEESDDDSDNSSLQREENIKHPSAEKKTTSLSMKKTEQNNKKLSSQKDTTKRPNKHKTKKESVGTVPSKKSKGKAVCAPALNKSNEAQEKVNELEMRRKKMAVRGTVLKQIKSRAKEDRNNDIEVISENIVKKPAITEEERVKRFLETAQASSSITVTRKKAMSSDTMKALDLLKKLKNISATRMISPSTPGSSRSSGNERAGPSKSSASPQQLTSTPRINRTPSFTPSPSFLSRSLAAASPINQLAISNVRGRQVSNGRFQNNRGRSGLPVISSVQSCNVRTPIIMSVRGNRGSSRPVSTPHSSGGPRQRTPILRGRGRGTAATVRGNARIVPVVVLD